MLSKCLYLAGRVAPPLVECVMTSSQQQQPSCYPPAAAATTVAQHHHHHHHHRHVPDAPSFHGPHPQHVNPPQSVAVITVEMPQTVAMGPMPQPVATVSASAAVPLPMVMPFFGGSALQPTAVLLAPRHRQDGGDWLCVCGFSNFASRMVCFGCQRPRTDGNASKQNAVQALRPGDWSCACGAHNFARRTSCVTCDAPKPIVSGYVQPHAAQQNHQADRILPGDWLCAACGAHNFRSRVACIKCSEKKPTSISSPTTSGPTSAALLTVPWTCAACHSSNPGSRKDCEICGVVRPHASAASTSASFVTSQAISSSSWSTTSTATSSSGARPGDWSCPVCNFSNFSTRSSCKNCTASRPEETGAAALRAPQEMKKGDWTCSCGYHNFARRVRCFECHVERPAEATADPPQTDAAAATN